MKPCKLMGANKRLIISLVDGWAPFLSFLFNWLTVKTIPRWPNTCFLHLIIWWCASECASQKHKTICAIIDNWCSGSLASKPLYISLSGSKKRQVDEDNTDEWRLINIYNHMIRYNIWGKNYKKFEHIFSWKNCLIYPNWFFFSAYFELYFSKEIIFWNF